MYIYSRSPKQVADTSLSITAVNSSHLQGSSLSVANCYQKNAT